jgi:peptidyl-prolyl cis-trans isomerase C
MARSSRPLALALATLALSASPTRAEAPPADDAARRAQTIVRGEGVEVTIGEVEDALVQQGALGRARARDPEQLKAVVQELARTELLAREALRRGYDKNAAVRQVVKESAAQALVRLEVEDKITPQSIPIEDVRAYYEANPGEFHKPQRRRASQIVLESQQEADNLLPEVRKLDARGFAELAKMHSKDDATRAQGGELGYFAREPLRDGSEPNVPTAIREAVFALSAVGDTSEPVAVGTRFALLRVTGERPERHATLTDAEPSIRGKLWRERRQQAVDALVASLRAKHKPQVFSDRIYRISFDDMEKRPGGFAPEPTALAKPADQAKPAP